MEHRYLLSQQDLLERPAWAAALRVRPGWQRRWNDEAPLGRGGGLVQQRRPWLCEALLALVAPTRGASPLLPAAVQGVTIKEGELLLSAAAYHSPMHLVSGAVTVRYPGRVQLASVAATAAAKAPGGGAHGGAAAEVYTCKRGFDTARGTVVALRRALEGLGQLGG